MKNMDGKSVIITGAGTGLGAATALALAKRGANITVNYAASAEAAAAVAEACRAEGVKAFAVKGSVADFADCESVVASAREAFGGVDVLINNAGITKFADQKDLDALEAEDFERIYRVNVIGAYQMVRAARKALDASGEGAVVNISSIAGVMGTGSSSAYAASKGALNTLTLSLARSLAPRIRVNAVCPGYMASGWFTKWAGAQADGAIARNIEQTTPLQRASTPEDIAETVVYFASPASRHVTGEFIMIDAGLHLGASPIKAR
ncbi:MULTISPECIES: glucose 1-dehydrogenase [Rhodomicrobium]|uniref:SDR family NAD(P)-dependent oxidoreductase n=1 Tax=Rhodomicrobium TaxID=1068 RepID=UPI000B4B9EEE|nr:MULTISPECIES: glucose 1-dehydrogenase [Rhodomicrobium]